MAQAPHQRPARNGWTRLFRSPWQLLAWSTILFGLVLAIVAAVSQDMAVTVIGRIAEVEQLYAYNLVLPLAIIVFALWLLWTKAFFPKKKKGQGQGHG